MSGTGFFDSVEIVDTPEDPSDMKTPSFDQQPSTSEVAFNNPVKNPNPPSMDSVIEQVVNEIPDSKPVVPRPQVPTTTTEWNPVL